jgi:hypothetical protein
MYGYPRTFYVCFSAPQSKHLSCPPNYEYSLIIGDAIPSNEGMVYHFLRSEYASTNRHVPLRSKYESLHLDVTGPGKRIIALVNMKNVYTIVEEKGIEDVISKNIPIPAGNAAPDRWIRNVIDELVRRKFLSPTGRGDTAEGVLREVRAAAQHFLATATEEHKELAGKGALGPQRTVPALVLRSSSASGEGLGPVAIVRSLSRRLSRSQRHKP